MDRGRPRAGRPSSLVNQRSQLLSSLRAACSRSNIQPVSPGHLAEKNQQRILKPRLARWCKWER